MTDWPDLSGGWYNLSNVQRSFGKSPSGSSFHRYCKEWFHVWETLSARLWPQAFHRSSPENCNDSTWIWFSVPGQDTKTTSLDLNFKLFILQAQVLTLLKRRMLEILLSLAGRTKIKPCSQQDSILLLQAIVRCLENPSKPEFGFNAKLVNGVASRDINALRHLFASVLNAY